MIEQRVKVYLMQGSADVAVGAQAEAGAQGRRHRWHSVFQRSLAQAVAGADGEFVAQELIQDYGERLLLEVEILRDTRRHIQ